MGRESFLVCTVWQAKLKSSGWKCGRKEWQHLPCNTRGHPPGIILTDSAGMRARALLFLCLTNSESHCMIMESIWRKLQWSGSWRSWVCSEADTSLHTASPMKDCSARIWGQSQIFWYWNKAVPFQSSQESNCSFLRLSCTYAISLLRSFLNCCSLAPVVAGCDCQPWALARKAQPQPQPRRGSTALAAHTRI